MSYRRMLLDRFTDLGRYVTSLPRRNARLRKMIPTDAVVVLNRGRELVGRSRRFFVPVVERSRYVNIYHCCVHKTGSQWLRSVFDDLNVYRFSGLTAHSYGFWLPGGVDPRKLAQRTFDKPFPRNTIVTPLYTNYENYVAVPKLGPSKAFFVMRDPRDLVVSWYYSIKISHLPMGRILDMRADLNALSKEDGLMYGIDYLQDYGQLGVMDSWAAAARHDPEVVVLRYEDIRKSDPEVFARLFDALDIRMPREVLTDMLAAYSFEQLSGRKGGKEDTSSHLRAGGTSSWQKHFTDKVLDHYHQVTGNLAERLGYPAD